MSQAYIINLNYEMTVWMLKYTREIEQFEVEIDTIPKLAFVTLYKLTVGIQYTSAMLQYTLMKCSSTRSWIKDTFKETCPHYHELSSF